MLALLSLAVGLSACNLGGGVSLDGGSDGDAAEIGADDALGDVDGEAGRDGGPGPITLVASRLDVITDRLCDLDGDGLHDNSLADLGSPGAGIVAAALTAVIGGSSGAEQRWIAHFPLVDDIGGPNDPETVAILATGTETEAYDDAGIEQNDLREPEDDFSGEESFYVGAGSVDECGEPRSSASGVVIDAGSFSAEVEQILTRLNDRNDLLLQRGHVFGEVEPFGEAGRIFVCGSVRTLDLGGLEGPESSAGLSLLEILVSGGASLGVPSVPGVTPDLDLDGDGLERFVFDEEGCITECVDGDATPIAGRDCWTDPRMADGLSITLEMEMVGARFAGLVPFWQRDRAGTCFNDFYCAYYHERPPPCGDLCDESEAPREALTACFDEHCEPASDWEDGWNCAWEECTAEALACREAGCCDDPPGPSLWEPR